MYKEKKENFFLKFYNFYMNKIDIIEWIIENFFGLYKGDIEWCYSIEYMN